MILLLFHGIRSVFQRYLILRNVQRGKESSEISLEFGIAWFLLLGPLAEAGEEDNPAGL
jgi:hypothetical protein